MNTARSKALELLNSMSTDPYAKHADTINDLLDENDYLHQEKTRLEHLLAELRAKQALHEAQIRADTLEGAADMCAGIAARDTDRYQRTGSSIWNATARTARMLEDQLRALAAANRKVALGGRMAEDA